MLWALSALHILISTIKHWGGTDEIGLLDNGTLPSAIPFSASPAFMVNVLMGNASVVLPQAASAEELADLKAQLAASQTDAGALAQEAVHLRRQLQESSTTAAAEPAPKTVAATGVVESNGNGMR